MYRIVIEGMRGKSETVEILDNFLRKRGYSVLSKSTGKEPIICDNGKRRTINRKGGFLIDHENKRCLLLAKDKDFVIFEDQAISPYTMRLFNNIIKPNLLLIPNIRLEHQEYLGQTIEEIAKSFAVHFNVPSMIITTEQKESVLKIFRHFSQKYNKKLIEVKCNDYLPSISNLYLVDEALRLLCNNGVSKQEWKEHEDKLKKRFSIKKSKEGVKYFIGSKINDVGSSFMAYNFLKEHYPDEKLCYLAYFRADRKDRAISFIHFFNKIGLQQNIKNIFLRGDFCNLVYNRLSKEVRKKTKIIKEKEIERIIAYCHKNNFVLVTSVNGVNGFMKNLENKLQKN